jgi:hypothetical protein
MVNIGHIPPLLACTVGICPLPLVTNPRPFLTTVGIEPPHLVRDFHTMTIYEPSCQSLYDDSCQEPSIDVRLSPTINMHGQHRTHTLTVGMHCRHMSTASGDLSPTVLNNGQHKATSSGVKHLCHDCWQTITSITLR